ncbi:MAG: Hsp20/alpha crystallin family protein [Promethearchaeota archaeon]
MYHTRRSGGHGEYSKYYEHCSDRFRHWFHRPKAPKFLHKMFHKWRSFMPYSVEATKTEYIIKMPLPGHDVKNIEVSVKKNCVLIETHAPQEEKKKEEQPRKIKGFGEFLWNKPNVEVMIPLEDEIDPDTVKAKLSRGILTVTIARRPGTIIDIEE